MAEGKKGEGVHGGQGSEEEGGESEAGRSSRLETLQKV